MAQSLTFQDMNLNLHSADQKINILSRSVSTCSDNLCLDAPTLLFQKQNNHLTLSAKTGEIDQKFNELVASEVQLKTKGWNASANLISYNKNQESLVLNHATLKWSNFLIVSPKTQIDLSQQHFKIKGPWSITYDKKK